MSVRLRELIKAVRQCKTAAEEREIIAKECANIRTSFKQEEVQHRHRNIAKLLFIHMLGHNTQFGQMECMKLIVSPSFGDKRMGYLGLMLLLDERQDVLMLVTNSLQTDLNHPNQYVVGLALCSLANISSPSIARDLSSDVIKLLGSPNPYIKKKAALCAIRVVRKVPELMEQFIPKVRPLLAERNHGVLITAIALMIELCDIEPNNINYFRKTVPHLVKILKNLVLSPYVPEHDINGVTDPFLQVKVLRLLRILGKGDAAASDAMNDILAQVATNTENVRNVGNAILYECVQTIMSIESEGGLRVLAINILGRFLLQRDNNIRYVALNTLQRVVERDQQAVQRHRSTVLDCLKDPDIAIRKRALDLTYALVNHSNVKVMVKELIQFLRTADLEFREDITAKICLLTDKYAPSPKWHVDTIMKVMAMAGHYVQNDVVAKTVHLISRTPDLQNYAVHKLYTCLTVDIFKQPLVQTAVWTIGEFGDLLVSSGKLDLTPRDLIQLLDTIVKHPATTLPTKQYVLSALVKFSDRFNNEINSDLVAEINPFRQSLALELQQRANEYFSIIDALEADKRAKLLEHIPPLEVQEEDQRDYQEGEEGSEGAGAGPASSGESAPSLLGGIGSESSGSSSGSSAGTNLLDLLGGGPSSAPSSAAPSLNDLLGGGSAPVAAPAGGLGGLLGLNTPSPAPAPAAGGSLLELLGGSSPAPSLGSPAGGLGGLGGLVSPSPLGGGGAIPPMVAFSKNGVQIKFDFAKQPGQNNVTLINATITNATPVVLNNFVFQAAVPPYMKIQLNPPSGNIVPPNNGGVVTQQMRILNANYGEKPPAMKLKLDFVVNGQSYSDEATLTTFPPGV